MGSNLWRKLFGPKQRKQPPSSRDTCYELDIKISTASTNVKDQTPVVAAYVLFYEHNYVSSTFISKHGGQPPLNSKSNNGQIILYWESYQVPWGNKGNACVYEMNFWITSAELPCDVVLGKYTTWGFSDQFPDPLYNASLKNMLKERPSWKRVFTSKKDSIKGTSEKRKRKSSRHSKEVLVPRPDFEKRLAQEKRLSLGIMQVTAPDDRVVPTVERASEPTGDLFVDNVPFTKAEKEQESINRSRVSPDEVDFCASIIPVGSSQIDSEQSSLARTIDTRLLHNSESVCTEYSNTSPSIHQHRHSHSNGSTNYSRLDRNAPVHERIEEDYLPISQQTSTIPDIPGPHSNSFDAGLGISHDPKLRSSIENRIPDYTTHLPTLPSKDVSHDGHMQPLAAYQINLAYSNVHTDENISVSANKHVTCYAPEQESDFAMKEYPPFQPDTAVHKSERRKRNKRRKSRETKTVKPPAFTAEELAEMRANDPYWTWNEDLQKFHHVDSDGSGVWFEESSDSDSD